MNFHALIVGFALLWLMWWLVKPESDTIGENTPKSTHKVEVVSIDRVLPHPNADKLEIIPLFGGGFQTVVGKGEFHAGELAAFVPPDSLVPLDREEFAFLKGARTPKKIDQREFHLVRSIRLRKESSFGLLVKIPPSFLRHNRREYTAIIGMDLAEHFEVKHWDPPAKNQADSAKKARKLAKKPKARVPFYDLDSLRRFTEVFEEGESVTISEKIHGANAAYLWEPRPRFQIQWASFPPEIPLPGVKNRSRKGLSIRHDLKELRIFFSRPFFQVMSLPAEAVNIHVRSRTVWRLYNPHDLWWKALTPQMIDLLKTLSGHVLFGEIYGDQVQNLTYGVEGAKFVAFDIYNPKTRVYESPAVLRMACHMFNVPTVPILETSWKYKFPDVLQYAEGPSILGKGSHVREGVVVRPLGERHSPKVGRVILKVVGKGYLEKVPE